VNEDGVGVPEVVVVDDGDGGGGAVKRGGKIPKTFVSSERMQTNE
jgi:hypothetical protein